MFNHGAKQIKIKHFQADSAINTKTKMALQNFQKKKKSWSFKFGKSPLRSRREKKMLDSKTIKFALSENLNFMDPKLVDGDE